MHVSDSVGHEQAEMIDKETFVSSDCCHSCFFHYQTNTVKSPYKLLTNHNQAVHVHPVT